MNTYARLAAFIVIMSLSNSLFSLSNKTIKQIRTTLSTIEESLNSQQNEERVILCSGQLFDSQAHAAPFLNNFFSLKSELLNALLGLSICLNEFILNKKRTNDALFVQGFLSLLTDGINKVIALQHFLHGHHLFFVYSEMQTPIESLSKIIHSVIHKKNTFKDASRCRSDHSSDGQGSKLINDPMEVEMYH